MNAEIRNIAIIAHVDHGKTTLVDGMLRQSGIFRDNEQVQERVMDSNDLEKERGITILSKNTAISYKGTKINIVDTPGHADFGGEVERVLSMVDGVLLLVDAYEGSMPQTKFVLRKALEGGLKPIVVINKIDRPDARPHEVIDEIFDLFLELGADDDQLEFPIVYASARDGYAKHEVEDESCNLEPLFETILEQIPVANGNIEESVQMLVVSLDYDSYLGRYAVGRINRGTLNGGQQVALIRHDGKADRAKIAKLFTYQGLKKVEVDKAYAGDIVAIAGFEEVNIGETVADVANPEQLPVIKIDEPTLTMNFIVNNSPFAGQEGEHVTSRKLRERLFKELISNVALKVEETDSPDVFKVSGRGELHLSILIETMRREGYELQVSKPQVICKYENGQKLEPIEHLVIDIPEESMGIVMENLGTRKAEMSNMISSGTGNIRLEFDIPARGLIGFRGEFMTMTRGEGIMNHNFKEYASYKGEIDSRHNGALLAFEDGEATTYGLVNVEDRGLLFITPGTKVYEGMIVGRNNRDSDIEVNVCKRKHLTNMRASGSDSTVKLNEPKIFTLEEAIEFIADDEYVEVTPKSIRMRKKLLNKSDRSRARNTKLKQLANS